MLKSWYMVFFQVCIHTITKGSRKLTQKSLQIELIVKISSSSSSLCFSAQFFPSFWQCPKTQLSSTLCSKMPICPTTRRSSLMLRILGMARVNMMQCRPTTRRSDFEDDHQEVKSYVKDSRDGQPAGGLILRMMRISRKIVMTRLVEIWFQGWLGGEDDVKFITRFCIKRCRHASLPSGTFPKKCPQKMMPNFRCWKHTSLHSGTTPPGTEQSTITGFSQRTEFSSSFYSDQLLFKKYSQTKLSSSFFLRPSSLQTFF